MRWGASRQRHVVKPNRARLPEARQPTRDSNEIEFLIRTALAWWSRRRWCAPGFGQRVSDPPARAQRIGVIGTGHAGHALTHLPSLRARPKQRTFPRTALFVAAVTSTTVPSDSRCAGFNFAIGLYEPLCPDSGRTDGPLVFHLPPCTRAAPLTPPRPAAHTPPDRGAADMAFAAT
jgi:hypothetical protein